MAKNYVQEGNVLDYTNTSGATILSGSAVLIGKRLAVALGDIEPNGKGQLAVSGVFALPRLNTDDTKIGEELYWDAAASHLTESAAGNTKAGYAAADAGAGVATVAVKLNA
jgi:predicted RecA/RadA family phage recombinase